MKTDTKIPGLTIDFQKSGANLYAYIVHKSSNSRVVKFNNAPLPFGKREFVKRVDQSRLTEIDWTKSDTELATKENFDLSIKAKLEILGHEAIIPRKTIGEKMTETKQRIISKEMMNILSLEAMHLRKSGDEAREAYEGLYKYFMMASDESLERLYQLIIDSQITIIAKTV